MLNLANTKPMTIIPGGLYKVSYYKKIRSTITEEGFYTYILKNNNITPLNNLAYAPLYNRPLEDIEGIIKSIELVK